MKRRSANGKGDKKAFSKSASKTDKKNVLIPRGGYRL